MMVKILKFFSLVILFGVFVAESKADRVVLREGFDTTINGLEKRGWLLPSTGVKIIPGINGNSIQVTSDSRCRYIKKYFPITPGKNYRGQVTIKCSGVKKARKWDRGAVLFFQFAGREKEHIKGGSFPVGQWDTKGVWKKQIVPFTRIRKPEVKFVNITIGIEGTGTALFDDLVVTEMADEIQLLKPVKGVHISGSRPEFKWEKIPAEVIKVSVSQDSNFPVDKTFSFLGRRKNSTIKPDFALAPGKWYWKVETFNPDLKSTGSALFYIAKTASKKPVTIFPLWQNRFFSDKPTLKARVYPKQNLEEVSVTVAGKKAKSLTMKDGIFSFIPQQKIDAGIYDIVICAAGKKFNFIYSTVKAPNRISYRADKIMLINDKPFFPLGAYRDPSDSINDFSGLKTAGFNLTHDYRFETPKGTKGGIEEAKRYLENARKNGLKVFMGVRRDDVKNFRYANIQKYCATLKGYDSLLAWYLYDEPLSAHSMVPVVALKKIYQAIKYVDKTHPVSIVFATMPTEKEIKSLKNTFDLLWTDNYPIENDTFDTQKYYQFLLNSKERSIDKPFWSVIQAHDTNIWYGKSKTPKYPTALQSRLLAHMSLAAGAEGLIWYWSPSKRTYNIKNNTPQIWKGISDTVQEIKKLSPYLTGNRKFYKLEVRPDVKYWSYSHAGKRVLAIMNISAHKLETNITLNLPSNASFRRFKTGNEVRIVDEKLQAELKPYEVKIYIWNE